MTTGIVNLFGDITYEGGGSINGPFMASLGATAAIVALRRGLASFLAMHCVCRPATRPNGQDATG
jgi:hypothetical protein